MGPMTKWVFISHSLAGLVLVMSSGCDSNGAAGHCANIPNAVMVQLDANHCAALTKAVFELVDGGAHRRVTTDARSRPVECVYATSQVVLNWSDDARTIVAVVYREGSSEDFSFPIDLTDENIRAAVNEYAARTGADVSSLLAYLDAHPGAVLAETLGIGAPRVKLGDGETAVFTKVRDSTFQNAPPFRDAEDYMDFLEGQAARFSALEWDFKQNIVREGRSPTPFEQIMQDLITEIRTSIGRIESQQARACFPCTAACGLGCMGACRMPSGGLVTCQVARATNCPPPGQFTPDAGCLEGDRGRCCVYRFGELVGCRDTGMAACTDVGGSWTPGAMCSSACDAAGGGACCLGGYACVTANDRADCERRSNEGGYRFFSFSEESSCAQLRSDGTCSNGVCCYPDGSYSCDYTGGESCAQGGRFVPGPCEAATCGN